MIKIIGFNEFLNEDDDVNGAVQGFFDFIVTHDGVVEEVAGPNILEEPVGAFIERSFDLDRLVSLLIQRARDVAEYGYESLGEDDYKAAMFLSKKPDNMTVDEVVAWFVSVIDR